MGEGSTMKIIQTKLAPNPRRVRIFLSEKGINVAFEERDLMENELKSDDFSKLNPLQRVPVLVLDDGTAISETVAICRYFEALHPEPSLFGSTALQQARIEMWQRRVELGLFFHIAQVFRHLNPKMGHLEVPQIAAWGEANKPKVEDALSILEHQLAANQYVAGDVYSIADITALVAIDFMKPAKLQLSEAYQSVLRWHRHVAARPSATS